MDANAAERDPALSGICLWVLVDRLFIIFMLPERAQSQRVWESTEVRALGLQFFQALTESLSLPFPESYKCLGRKVKELFSVQGENDL